MAVTSCARGRSNGAVVLPGGERGGRTVGRRTDACPSRRRVARLRRAVPPALRGRARDVRAHHGGRIRRRRPCAGDVSSRAAQSRDRKISERWGMETTASAAPDQSLDTELLATALRALTPEQREVLVLCRFHDLPFSVVAATLNCKQEADRVR